MKNNYALLPPYFSEDMDCDRVFSLVTQTVVYEQVPKSFNIMNELTQAVKVLSLKFGKNRE